MKAFSILPYENLTKILKSDSVISASSAMRYPDELLGDFLKWGTGGTCFSLTAAVVAVFEALGIIAHPVLADRHYGPDTHCGISVTGDSGQVFLLDPGYLVFEPIPVPREIPVTIGNGFNRIELNPLASGARVELYTIVRNNRKLRLTFKMEQVGDEAFRRAWEQSFAFEMMHYPVLTSIVNGAHLYIQGNSLSIRDDQKTIRRTLTKENEIEYITAMLGIHREIVIKALEKVNYGRCPTAAAG
jgi:hypothetical protein